MARPYLSLPFAALLLLRLIALAAVQEAPGMCVFVYSDIDIRNLGRSVSMGAFISQAQIMLTDCAV